MWRFLKKTKRNSLSPDLSKSNNHSADYNAMLHKSIRMFINTSIMTLVAVIALVASTIAWFANNRNVQTNNSTVSSAVGDPCLYIEVIGDENQDAPIKEYKVTAAAVATGNLYPISTLDCANWYRAKSFNNEIAKFDTYENVTSDIKQSDVSPDQYVYTVLYDDDVEKTFTAYSKSQYWVYTDEGDVGVWFLNGGISISIDTEKDTNERAQYLRDSLRVGLFADDKLIMIYGLAESGTGNSKDAGENKFYAIIGADAIQEVGESQKFYSDLSSYVVSGSENQYVKGSADAPLFSTDADGVKLSVYTWLEGTDAQAIRGLSNGAKGVSVSLDLAGVAL